MIIFQYLKDFFRLSAPRNASMAAGADSLKKPHD